MDEATLRREGWEALELSGFSAVAGPFWIRREGTRRQVGFIADAHHTNAHMGNVHGGMLMTFADVGLGLAVVDAIGGYNCVTAQLQVQFVSRAVVGAFVICHPEIVRQTRQLVFMRGLIAADGTTVASAEGIWKVLEREPDWPARVR